MEDMKFDLIISNPPYNRNIDLKILKAVYEFGEKICFIHPAGWLYNNKEKNKIEIRDQVKDHFKKYELIENSNKLFNIGVFTEIFITLFDKNCKQPINIYDIDIHGVSKTYQSLKTKILNYCRNNENLLQKVSLDKQEYNCSFSKLRGNPDRKDFYTFIQLKDENYHLHPDNTYHCNFSFKCSEESIYFKNFLKLKITRFCLSIYKNDVNMISYNPSMKQIKTGNIASVPYMPTYTRPWTDEDVAKELGLTEEELAWAINWIPDYYPEDAEKYAKWKDYPIVEKENFL